MGQEEIIQTVAAGPRASLITDIVAHPKGSASLPELEFLNPNLETEAIRNHLTALQKAGVVEEHVLDPESHDRKPPKRFYAITDEARDLLDEHGVFPEQEWQNLYTHVQKPDQVRELEELTRPRTQLQED